MAFSPGTSKLDTVSTNGDGILTSVTVTSSDPNIVAVTQMSDVTFRLDMLAVGHADIVANAINSAGAPLTNTIGVDVALPAGDTLTQTITDLP